VSLAECAFAFCVPLELINGPLDISDEPHESLFRQPYPFLNQTVSDALAPFNVEPVPGSASFQGSGNDTPPAERSGSSGATAHFVSWGMLPYQSSASINGD
jgi:hypothetical protein